MDSAKHKLTSAKVYRDMEQLTKRLFELVELFPRDMKPLFGNRIIEHSLDTISAIHAAYKAQCEKLERIEDAVFCFEKVLILVRIAHDMKIISNKQHASLFEQITSIQNQLENWRSKYVKFKDDTSKNEIKNGLSTLTNSIG